MPLIHDNPWLVSQLLQSVADEEKRLDLFKRGQAAAAADAQIAGALRALLSNLRDQITPAKEDPNQVGYGSGGAELASHHMDSLGDLVEWIAVSAIKVGSIPLVVPGTEERPSEDYGHFKIEPGTDIVTPLARPDRTAKAYWINTGALKQYLVSLQSDQKLKGNPIFQVQLLKVVQDANRLGLDMSETYEAPAIDDGQEVDRLPKTLDPRQWNQPGTEQLLFGNIKSLEALNAWFGQAGRGYMVGQKTVTIKDQEWNICVVLNILKTRADALYQRRTAESGPIMQAYVKQIADVQKQANCPGSGQQPGQPGQGQGQGQGGTQITPRALVGLATLKPFNTQRIDFQEITTFLDRYVQLKPDMAGLAMQAKNAMQQANGVMNSPGAPFPMGNITQQSLNSRTRNPQYLLQYLHNVIDITGRVYMDFYNECQNVLRDLQGGSGIIAGVEEQIAAGGPYQMNLSDLERLQEQYPQR